MTGALCITAPGPQGCPAPSYVPSDVTMVKWEGENLPAFESLTSELTKSQSSVTVLAFGVLAFIVVMTAGTMLVAAGATTTALGPATFIHGLFAVGPASDGA